MSPKQDGGVLPILPVQIATARWVLRGYVVIASLGLVLHIGINLALGHSLNSFYIAMMAIIAAAGALSLYLLRRSLASAMRLNTWTGTLCVWSMVMQYLNIYPDENLVAIILMLHANIFALSLILGFRATLEYATLASVLLLIMGLAHPARMGEVIALSFVAFGVMLPSKLVERLIKESTAEIVRANIQLSQEVMARRQAEERLKRYSDYLEDAINARTAELALTNQSLREEIAERQQVEATLRQQTAELQARNEDLDAFAHTVAHDLKNPLGPILGVAQVMENDFSHLPKQEVCHGMHIIARNSARMNNIIDALLLLADVRQMKAADIQPLDMASITAEALGRVADAIKQSQAEVVTPDNLTWPVVWGHPTWIEEVWVNYLTNALKYGGTPPHVELGFSHPGFYVRDSQCALANPKPAVKFWVRDSGPGIPLERQASLFTPFTRLHQAHIKGHGLGLSVVRRIVEKLDGQVGVESQPGQGSLFFFSLPLAGG
jgi:signal transduction histidine kinase